MHYCYRYNEISMDPFGYMEISMDPFGYMEISMDPFGKTFLNNISLNVTGYMEISVDPLVKAKYMFSLLPYDNTCEPAISDFINGGRTRKNWYLDGKRGVLG
ncbi:hypothetical protein P5673_006881 [Acropora cervicornis]|uniref:Uncharacterized protein n=1 Tax=Acropora cervicornis TaxID=6130 RepID=A0AAD9QXE0_ACRCE|nr:hypothetical protein P5673_006881 [Acropora cervicornis]